MNFICKKTQVPRWLMTSTVEKDLPANGVKPPTSNPPSSGNPSKKTPNHVLKMCIYIYIYIYK